MTREDLQQIRELMREEIAPINQRLDKLEENAKTTNEHLNVIDQRLDRLEDNTAVTREAVSSLCEWADNVAVITQVHFPVRKNA